MNEQQAQQFAQAFSRVYGRVTNVGKHEVTTLPVGSDTPYAQTFRIKPGEQVMYGVSVNGICKLFNQGAKINTAVGADGTTICIFDWTEEYKV